MTNSLVAKLADYEEIIKQIKDVVSARIVSAETGEIAEVHVLASQHRSPKQVVRDIESALMASFGLAIDHKKISVAQLQVEEAEEVLPQLRPRLGKVELTVNGISAEARVSLTIAGTGYLGTATGTSAANNRLRLIAIATLNALEEYLGGACAIAVEAVSISQIGGREVALVGLSLVTAIDEEFLVGSALVKGDVFKTIVKATLDGVNRRISLIINE
ncbi:MAG TPA: hypothetical protein VHS59_12255 [Bacillota bacterium]|nr:hypothetical protein [Bacillota bacterium]